MPVLPKALKKCVFAWGKVAATRASCVAITKVAFSAWALVCNRCKAALAALSSRLAVGSSAKITCGRSSTARASATQVLMPGLSTLLDQARSSLQPQPISLRTLPADLKRDWVTPDGRARVSVIPKGDSNNNAVLTRFITAVVKVAPDATGTPVGIHEGGRTVAGAFTEAGVTPKPGGSTIVSMVRVK